MALADVCGFDLGGKSKLSLGFGEDFSGPSAVDALAASQRFTVPQGIDVRRNVMLQFIHFALSLSYFPSWCSRSGFQVCNSPFWLPRAATK